MSKNVLTYTFSEPLNGLTTAVVNIVAGDGNLTIDGLTDSEQVLSSGTLQYFEKQGLPSRTLNSNNGQTTFMLIGRDSRRPWFRFPWTACNGAYEWLIHLNPMVSFDVIAHSSGGNVKLNLAGLAVTRLSTDTGGGNMDLDLPSNAANLRVNAKSGAGNVTVGIGSGLAGSNTVTAESGAGNVVVRLPGGVAARIHASTGLGKEIVDSRFSKTDDNTFQSSDFESAANKVEVAVKSGAGNVSVITR